VSYCVVVNPYDCGENGFESAGSDNHQRNRFFEFVDVSIFLFVMFSFV
jgi:hypothetical protein